MLKIYCVYFDKRPFWRSDCVEPIQAGKARSGLDLGILADDTGENISADNAHYGEMTAWYWLWKNHLPKHPEITHIGFSHYRRFLDFFNCGKGKIYRTTYERFKKHFEKNYNEAAIMREVGDADVVMRGASSIGWPTVREQFMNAHPENVGDLDNFVSLIKERHPGNVEDIEALLMSGKLAMELQFVMKRELFEDFMEWAFSLCKEFERRWQWHGPTEGERARIPAFLVERFFNFWLFLRKKERGLKVREMQMVKLNGRTWWFRLFKHTLLPLFPASMEERLLGAFK